MIATFGTGAIKSISKLKNDGKADVCELIISVDNNIDLPFKVWSSAAIHMSSNLTVGDKLTFEASPRKENNELFFKIVSYVPHESNRNI